MNPLNAVEVTCTENKKCTDEDEGLRKFNTLADEGEYLMQDGHKNEHTLCCSENMTCIYISLGLHTLLYWTVNTSIYTVYIFHLSDLKSALSAFSV